ncbi:inositol monophosphatase [Aeromicrobium sp. PE09-221]|uniref:inositol monophosphatase family protein n=1 Tax=Aeromicrobium sp. PE09-221 TaxID=1898043 RepID=UPI000B3E8553|nr:inositol monophosphatase family protein [Aeromicrobium sp. PE09-221]OUZ08357.1 inositol monophosphatase [Aeromicrobium sp. PE09-221]
MTERNELLALGREVGLEAAELVRRLRPAGRVGVVATKSSPTDAVTEIDRASERLIRDRILSARPDDGFVGEEGEDVIGTSGVEWIVDPIDGTVNFVYGIPAYAVSIAARTDATHPTATVGYVVNIATGSEYGAVAGGGAWRWRGDERETLHGPPSAPLSQMLVGTGFAYDAPTRERQAAAIARLLPRIRDIRRIGSAALDLVAVAAGELDAYAEQGLNPWDLAAGGLIAAEAGLVVGGLEGPAGKRLTMVARPDIWEEYSELVRTCGL